jgi:hypothetical protein
MAKAGQSNNECKKIIFMNCVVPEKQEVENAIGNRLEVNNVSHLANNGGHSISAAGGALHEKSKFNIRHVYSNFIQVVH